MLKSIIEFSKNLDLKIKKIMKYGFAFSLIFCLISILILYTYHAIYRVPLVFKIGTILFKSSLMFFVDFIICGYAFDIIKKQLLI